MTESQVRSVAVHVVGFTITALLRITVKHHTERRVKRRRRRGELGETGRDVATNATMTDVSNSARELLLASTLGKESMNVNFI